MSPITLTDRITISPDVTGCEHLDKMAQFGFENDIHSILKLDMPITNAPMARWQRKASSSNASALSPGKSANVSLSTTKTPSKTPGSLCNSIYATYKRYMCFVSGDFNHFFCIVGKNKKQTPSKMGGDRFIPTRNSKQMDVASFLLTKENETVDTNEQNATSVQNIDLSFSDPIVK